MIRSHLVLWVLFAATVACVPATLDLGANHPALPGSRAGAILRPESALVQTSDTGTPDGTRENPYVGRGVVRGYRDGGLVLEHEAIPGFMGAMTMAYPVAEGIDPEDFAPGDRVAFKVEVPQPGAYRIFDVERIDPVGAEPR
jgi:hypothetical protein